MSLGFVACRALCLDLRFLEAAAWGSATLYLLESKAAWGNCDGGQLPSLFEVLGMLLGMLLLFTYETTTFRVLTWLASGTLPARLPGKMHLV
jgi:hypothetical protein